MIPDFRVLFESSPDLYLVLSPDPGFSILAVTDAYASATMTAREQILGRGLFEIFPDNPADEDASGVRNLRTSLQRALEDRVTDVMAVQKYDIRGPSGMFEQRWWSPTNTPVMDADNVVRYIIHRVEDVTDYVRMSHMRAELLDRAARSEAEVYLRNQELKATNEELRKSRILADEANRAKSDFLSSMSHELRTPLNAIIGFTELLLDGYVAPGSTTHSEFLHDILHSGRHLLRLINEILDLSKIEAKKIDLLLEGVEVRDLVSSVIGTLQPNADKSGTALHFELPGVPLYAFADRTRLSQILMNFGSNAIKYGKIGGDVTFSLFGAQDKVCIAVTDNGPGISLEKQGKLFEPFYRAGQEHSGIEGTGIGLSIAKKLAQSMDGDVGLSSEVGVGSTFWVQVPRVR